MRHLLSLCFLCAGLSVASLAGAQDIAKTAPPPSSPSPSSEPPQTESVKPEPPAEKADGHSEEQGFDAEEYFKRGEDNIYKGSNCAPPPDIIT